MVKFYIVGGFVRDKYLNRMNDDIDYSVEADSYQEMIQNIILRGFKIVHEVPEYYTVKAKKDGKTFDFVLCRKDGEYIDGRRPETVQLGNLIDDLSRRDFTINAMAEDESNQLIDPFNGMNDINNRIIRCVGNINRIKEDALRLIRAIRFCIVLPQFQLDNEIHQALNDPAIIYLLKNVSHDRIRDELEKCFMCNSLLTITTLNQYPLLMNQLFQNQNMWLKPTVEQIKKQKQKTIYTDY